MFFVQYLLISEISEWESSELDSSVNGDKAPFLSSSILFKGERALR